MGKGRKHKGGGNSHRTKTHGRGYQAQVVHEPKAKPEEDKTLVTESRTWNGLRGLHNLGNTCYFNSIMQNLVQTIPLRTHLVPRDPFNPTEPANRPKAQEAEMAAALRSTLIQMWLGTQRSYDPNLLFGAIESKVPRFRRKLQQDAHELLRLLMDEIDTEILIFLKKFKREYLGKPMSMFMPPKPAIEAPKEPADPSSPAPAEVSPPAAVTPPDDRIITLDFFVRKQAGNLVPNDCHNVSEFEIRDKSGLVTYMEAIFGGRIESTLMCHSCGSCSSTYETFMDLSVPIPVRFLDDKLKRILGYIPMPKSQAKKGSAQPKLEEVEVDEEESKIEFKAQYDFETLSSQGSSNSYSIGQRNSHSSDTSTSTQYRKDKNKPGVAAKLQAARLAAAQAVLDKKRVTPPKIVKPMNKKDRKKAKRAQEASEREIPDGPADLSQLTEEQLMELALEVGDDEDLATQLAIAQASAANTEEHPDTSSTALEGVGNDQPSSKQDEVKDSPSSKDTESKQDVTEIAPQDESISVDAAPTEHSPPSEVVEDDSKNSEPIQSINNTTTDPENTTNQINQVNEAETVVDSTLTSDAVDSTSNHAQTVASAMIDQSSVASQDGSISPIDSSVQSASIEVDSAASSSTEPNKDDSKAVEPISEVAAGGALSTSIATPSGPGHSASTESSKKILNPALRHDGRSNSRPTGLTIDACLFEFTEPEVLFGSNAYGCYECTKRHFAAQGRDLTRLIMAYGTDEEKRALQGSSQYESALTEPSDPSPSLSSSAPSNSESTMMETASTSTATTESLETPQMPSTSAAPSASESDMNDTSTSTVEESMVSQEPDNPSRIKPADPTSESKSDAGSDNDEEDGESDEEVPIVVHEKTEDEVAVEKEKAEAKRKLLATKEEKSIPLVKSVATKQILIDEVPQVLTLHLKRFWQTLNGSAKIDQKVEFPMVLDLAPYLSRSARKRYSEEYISQTGTSPKRPLNLDHVRYQLYGIVVHQGSLHGGHYVAYTRRRDNPISDSASLDDIKNGWHYFSDTQMSATTLDMVLAQQAYILFYERLSD